MTSVSGGDNRLQTGQRLAASKSSYRVAVNDINRPSPVLLMSLIIPALLACTVAYYLATMPLEPAGSTVPATPALVIDVRTTTMPAVAGDRPTGTMPTPAMMPLATPALINSVIYAPAVIVTVYIPIVMR